MKNVKTILLFAAVLLIAACSSDDNSASTPMSTLTVNLTGIEPLEGDLTYEGWIMVGGSPVSTGRFNTTAASTSKNFSIPTADLDVATAFILSIEPTVNDDAAPSNTKILSGNFVANAATLNITTMVGNFVNTTNPFSGSFLKTTPTDNTGGIDNGNEDYGIWFIQNGTTAGLINLPTLATGWKYEGWVVFNTGSTPVTTGQFTMANGVDSASPYSGNEPAPLFPGEDFLSNLPAGVDGNINGLPVVISIEPDLDGDANTPFFLKPISGTEGINSNALSVTTNINALISGTAQIN
ncbi:anti-sigma factor [Oceanihabitans sp. 2_MG-2023]|uniref:anti-sigma factor n=1 Tax=Oceanihabitans sp. 2_MG-2023 TaxID=3062661 RepID=UPI0026E2AEBD|nr:anti-sigma factor [Oceanihabitans sp. 2_MG-2023]MDO6598030.1 anti-sigma factor [Oceanihabitans sp. 2_MG-2023]